MGVDEMRKRSAAAALGRAEAAMPSVRNAEQDVVINQTIGSAWPRLIEPQGPRKAGERVNVLTHCNPPGCDRRLGTATAPIYRAQPRSRCPCWVDRPGAQPGRPRDPWELGHQAGALRIPDNTGGHLMQQGVTSSLSERPVTANARSATRCTYLKGCRARQWRAVST